MGQWSGDGERKGPGFEDSSNSPNSRNSINSPNKLPELSELFRLQTRDSGLKTQDRAGNARGASPARNLTSYAGRLARPAAKLNRFSNLRIQDRPTSVIPSLVTPDQHGF